MVDFDLVFGLAADEDSDSENILEVDTGESASQRLDGEKGLEDIFYQ